MRLYSRRQITRNHRLAVALLLALTFPSTAIVYARNDAPPGSFLESTKRSQKGNCWKTLNRAKDVPNTLQKEPQSNPAIQELPAEQFAGRSQPEGSMQGVSSVQPGQNFTGQGPPQSSFYQPYPPQSSNQFNQPTHPPVYPYQTSAPWPPLSMKPVWNPQTQSWIMAPQGWSPPGPAQQLGQAPQGWQPASQPGFQYQPNTSQVGQTSWIDQFKQGQRGPIHGSVQQQQAVSKPTEWTADYPSWSEWQPPHAASNSCSTCGSSASGTITLGGTANGITGSTQQGQSSSPATSESSTPGGFGALLGGLMNAMAKPTIGYSPPYGYPYGYPPYGYPGYPPQYAYPYGYVPPPPFGYGMPVSYGGSNPLGTLGSLMGVGRSANAFSPAFSSSPSGSLPALSGQSTQGNASVGSLLMNSLARGFRF